MPAKKIHRPELNKWEKLDEAGCEDVSLDGSSQQVNTLWLMKFKISIDAINNVATEKAKNKVS